VDAERQVESQNRRVERELRLSKSGIANVLPFDFRSFPNTLFPDSVPFGIYEVTNALRLSSGALSMQK